MSERSTVNERGTAKEQGAPREQGTVKWYSLAKGYGFIHRETAEDGEEDVFMHHSEVPDGSLAEGEHVSFETVDGPKGLSARNIQRVSPDADPRE